MTASGEWTLPVMLPDEEATRQLAVEVGAILGPGDVVTLTGDLGVGKTTFARALVRYLAADADMEVASPTFTLMQVYELPRFPVAHIDLYRVSNPDELAEIGIAETLAQGVTLVEWPERAPNAWPDERLDIALMLAPRLGGTFRRVRITGRGRFAQKLERMAAIRRFLEEAGYGEAQRAHLQGDASTRAYERIVAADRRAILMNAPRRPDGPPVRDGLSYSAVAHLAEDVKPFVAMARALRRRGFSAPDIYAADLAEGLIVLEDLGAESLVAGDPPAPIEERYKAALDVLIALHQQDLPTAVPVAPHVEYALPSYDIDAFSIEVELLLDWYLPHQGKKIAARPRRQFTELWQRALKPALDAPPTWVLRDFHSPNLLWLPDREGIARVGLLDFQDALLGPAAYDAVSLLQDARVDVPDAMEVALLGHYARARREADSTFDPAQFVEIYALLGAQRATKILGIFARLDRRDGKPQYLRHLPRVWRNLTRSLSHASLARLRAWYETNVPAPAEK